MTILVVGNATVDRTHAVPHLPRAGETLLARATRREPGGKGLNQAVTAARAGAVVRFIAQLGDDQDAALIRAFLAGEGLADGLLAGHGESDRSTILVDPLGENLIVSTAEQARALPEDAAIAALAGLASGDTLLVQGNLSAALTGTLLRTARAAGVRTIANAAPLAWDWRPLLPLVDLLVVNEVEAAEIGAAPDDAAALLGAAQPGAAEPAAVVRTRGALGAVLVTPAQRLEVAAPAVASVDSTGAGDVLCGALAAGLDRGLERGAALRAAVAAASLMVQRPGTGAALPGPAELRALLG